MKKTLAQIRDERLLEATLVTAALGLAVVMSVFAVSKMIILNLFFLPVVLGGFYLGRYRAGLLAFFSALAASIVTLLNLRDFVGYNSPLMVGFSVTLWAAVLGLTAMLVGTLSDERMQSLRDLHEAHMGVVEVLSRYLQSAHPKLKLRSQRVAELSQAVAREMDLTARECDNIRVAALLYDMENIEITARVIRKAVGDIDSAPTSPEHSFHGSDLAHSLGSVLSGAFPLMLAQGDGDPLCQVSQSSEVPLGAKIIRAVRDYDRMMRDVGFVTGDWSNPPRDAIDELRRDPDSRHSRSVLDALEHVIAQEQAHSLLAASVN